MMDTETKFIQAIKDYGVQTDIGNSRKVNSLLDKIIKTKLKIKEDKDQVVLLLNKYLTDENEYVSYNCATFLLEFEPLKAEKKLESLAVNSDFCAFEAEITLEEWEKGALRFPPY